RSDDAVDDLVRQLVGITEVDLHPRVSVTQLLDEDPEVTRKVSSDLAPTGGAPRHLPQSIAQTLLLPDVLGEERREILLHRRRAAELSTESLEPDHDSDEDREVTGQAEVETTQQLHHRRRRSSHVSVTRGRILREVFAHPMVDRPFEGLRIRGGWSSADDEQNIGQARDVPLDDRHEQTHHIMASGA